MQERRDVPRPIQLFEPVCFPIIPGISGRQLSFKKTNFPVSFDITTEPRVARPVDDLAFAIERPTIYVITRSSSSSGVEISTLLFR